jgi:hypothetical protein
MQDLQQAKKLDKLYKIENIIAIIEKNGTYDYYIGIRYGKVKW